MELTGRTRLDHFIELPMGSVGFDGFERSCEKKAKKASFKLSVVSVVWTVSVDVCVSHQTIQSTRMTLQPALPL
jgi:hypothetical protein